MKTQGPKLEKQLPRLLRFRPHAVIIVLGGNDIKTGCDPAAIAGRLLNLRRYLLQSGVVQVAICRVAQRGDGPYCNADIYAVFRQAVNEYLGAELGRTVLDLNVKWRFPKHYDSGLIHANDKGMLAQLKAIGRHFRSMLV